MVSTFTQNVTLRLTLLWKFVNKIHPERNRRNITAALSHSAIHLSHTHKHVLVRNQLTPTFYTLSQLLLIGLTQKIEGND